MLTAAIYLPVLLWLGIRFAEGVLSATGYWALIVAIAVLVAITIWAARNLLWGVLLRVGRSGLAGLVARARTAVELPSTSHVGMPSLRGLASRIGLAERIPPKLFYVPLAVQWMWLSLRYGSLSLPTLANPLIEVGGLWGESKKIYLDMVSGEERRWLARYVTLTRGKSDRADDDRRAVELSREAGLTFPLVAKPDIGWQGYGVRPIASESELRAYVDAFPEGATLMLQKMVAWEGEAGVFYVRQPGEEKGKVISVTFRYFPQVVGDGVRTVRDLILADQRASWKAARRCVGRDSRQHPREGRDRAAILHRFHPRRQSLPRCGRAHHARADRAVRCDLALDARVPLWPLRCAVRLGRAAAGG
jgi:hypothetical protein